MEGIRRMSPVKFRLLVELHDDDVVNVKTDNEGDTSLYTILGLLERIKVEMIQSISATEKEV